MVEIARVSRRIQSLKINPVEIAQNDHHAKAMIYCRSPWILAGRLAVDEEIMNDLNVFIKRFSQMKLIGFDDRSRCGTATQAEFYLKS
jgi:hypothetical protein